MKTYLKMILIFLLLFSVQISVAQTYGEKSTIAGIEDQQNKSSQINFITSQFVQANNASRTEALNNNIYVDQVGNFNTVFSQTNSTSSNINLTQRGNNNDISLTIAADNIQENVSQIGNNNSFLDFSTNNADFHFADISQEGNNHNLSWFGGKNSVSEGLSITMQGQGTSIIVNNF